MARPLVLVFQEIAQPQASPNTPDLDTVVVGPAYVIKDYPDDASEILLPSAYGQLEAPAGGASAYAPPITGEDALTVVSYPGNAPGAVVDHQSVKLVLKFPRVILGSTYLSSTVAPVLGTAVETFTSAGDENKVKIAGANLVAAGVQAGDRIVLTSSAGQTQVRTVASVGEPDSAGAPTDVASLRLSQNLPAAGAGADAWTYNNTGECRIERSLITQELVDTAGTIVTFPEAGSDKLVVKGGITLPVTIGGVTVQRSLSHAEVYLAYRALRQDLAELGSITTASLRSSGGVATLGVLGKIDARNPLAAACHVALQNAGTAPIHYYGVTSDDAVGHAAAREALNTRRNLYTFVPLTSDINVLAGYKFEFEQLADPAFAAEVGVPQKLRVVLGSGTLPVATTVFDGGITGVAEAPSGAASGKHRTLNLTGTPSPDVSSALPGDKVTIGLAPWAGRRGHHTVSHVNTTGQLELEPGSSRWNDTAGDAAGAAEIHIVSASGQVKYSRLGALQVVLTVAPANGFRVDMKAPTVLGGPYRLRVVTGSSLAVSLSGFDITVTADTAADTTQEVVDALNAHPVVSSLLKATLVGSSTALSGAMGYQEIKVLDASAAASADGAYSVSHPVVSAVAVVQNDALYVRLFDASGLFLTSGVKAGDTVEIPVNANDYTSAAFDGRMFSYKVAQVVSENRLLIQNLGDDAPGAATELPHGYSRDQAGLLVDNETASTPGALRYRIRRALSKDDQVAALVGVAQSFRSKRVTLCWPDEVLVAGLKDGALPRVRPALLADAGWQPGWYVAAQVGGAMAGLPPQHGLTNLGLAGVSRLRHSNGYFTEAQLTRLSDGGWFVMYQRNPTDLPFCVHQLTTDVSAIETGELSVVKNVDFLSRVLQEVAEGFLGQYNVLPENLDALQQALQDSADNLKARRVAKIGPPLIDGKVTLIKVSDFARDRVQIFFRGEVARPLNNIDLHVVV